MTFLYHSSRKSLWVPSLVGPVRESVRSVQREEGEDSMGRGFGLSDSGRSAVPRSDILGTPDLEADLQSH